MADLEVPVQADHGHRDETPTAKKEASPAIETATLPAEQPAVGETRYNKKGLSCHCEGREEEDKKTTEWKGKISAKFLSLGFSEN